MEMKYQNRDKGGCFSTIKSSSIEPLTKDEYCNYLISLIKEQSHTCYVCGKESHVFIFESLPEITFEERFMCYECYNK